MMTIKRFISTCTSLLVAIILTGCTTFAATNNKLSNLSYPIHKAQFVVEPQQDRGSNKKSLVILALSGGGSRAAVLSSSVMLGLEKVFSDEDLNLLEEVDVISSVSGGSLPAAYYVISQDPGTERCDTCSGRYWDTDTVNKLMTKNYLLRWFGNWFWPTNIAKYWFTAYDRSDIMAQTFADNLFDTKYIGHDLTFANINPERPNLIINSTNGTTAAGDESSDKKFSNIITFTSDDFIQHANSDIYQYDIARAVMASASFPAVFNFMTLHDYRNDQEGRYLHMFDGGNADNLGLRSVERVIKKNPGYDRVIVILVDAFIGSQGVSSEKADARSLFSFFVDLNFIDSSNSLLENNRTTTLENFKKTLNDLDRQKTLFYHVKFEDVPSKIDRDKLNAIATDFRIASDDALAIQSAVMNDLITKENICLQEIRRILVDGKTKPRKEAYCTH